MWEIRLSPRLSVQDMPVDRKKYIFHEEAGSCPFLDQKSFATVAVMLISALLRLPSPLICPGFPQVALSCPLNFTRSYTWWGSEQWTEFLVIKLYHFPVLAPWSQESLQAPSSIPSFRVLGDPKYFSYTFINRWSFRDPQRKSNHFTGFTLFSPFPTVWAHIIVPPPPTIAYVEF